MNKLPLLILIVSFLFVGTACQSNTITEVEPAQSETTYDYAAGEWGQKEPWGMQLKLNADGTFEESFAGESDAYGISGSYEVTETGVNLKVEKYLDLSFEEAHEKYNVSFVEDKTLTLEKSTTSVFFTDYLAENGKIHYWNRLSKLPEGEKRELENYIVVSTQSDLKPKAYATAKRAPVGGVYTFNDCMPSCEDGEEHIISEVYKRVLARTEFQEELNGALDYWYLVDIDVPWYSVAKLNGEYQRITTAWMHGSELE